MSKNVIDAELRITGTSNTAKVFDQMVKDAKRGTDALKKAADYDAIVAKIKPLQTALDGVAKTSTRAGAQLAADASKISAEYGRLKGALDLSEPLKRSLAQMQLSQQQVGRLLKDAGRMQRDREAALSGIGNPRIRAQVMAADTANVERQLRERARLMKVENDIAAQIARRSADHQARFAGRLYVDPADARSFRERTTFSARMERQRAALEKAEQADLRAADAQAIANGRRQIAFASRMAKQRQAEERQLAAQELRAARELAREAAAAERAAAREASQVAREAAQAKRQAAQERMRAAREAARTAREAARVEATALREAARETARAERDARRQERRQHAYDNRIGHLGRGVVAGVGLGYGAHEAGHLARETVQQGAEYRREQARGYLAGLTPDEQHHANTLALELQGKFPSINRVQVLEHLRSLRGTFGDMHHAETALPEILKSQVVLGTMRGNDKAAHDLDQVVKGLEGAGLASNPERFDRMLDSFLKASSLFGDTITGEGFREYIQNSKSSKYGLSEAYLAGVVPTMMQHDGAGQFGTMQRMAFSALIGDRQTKKATAAQMQFGVRDKNGKLLDEQQFVSDPYQWAVDHIMPQMAKRGIDLQGMGREKGAILLTRLFSNANAGEFFASLLMNQTVVEKDRANLKLAKGREAADELRTRDPNVAMEGLTQSVKTFAQALSDPLIQSAPRYMNALTDSINKLSGWMDAHPQEVKTGTGVAAVAGAVVLPSIVGHSMKALAGEGTGIIANGLRLGGGALTGLGVPMLALGAGAGFAGYATAQEYGKTFKERGPGGFDPATGSTLDGNPMSGLAPDHPWAAEAIRDWWTKTMPTWAGGAEEAGKQVGENIGKAIVNAPLPPQRPTMLDDFRAKADETGSEAGKTLLQRIIESVGTGINIPINFVPGDGGGMGGGGSGIQKASFGGGGSLGGLIQRASFGGSGGSFGSGARGGSALDAVGSGGGGAGGSGGEYVANIGGRTYRAAYASGGRERVASWLDFYQRPVEQGGLGMAADKARAMVAMMQGESGINLNPGALGDHRGGTPTAFGTAQWRLERAANLRAMATRMGLPWTDVRVQQAHQRAELLGLYGRGGNYRGVYDAIQAAPDGNHALAIGIDRYENPAKKALAYRFRKPYLDALRRNPPSLGTTAAERAAALEPHLVRGADGKDGLDLGDGTMKMPDGSIRPIPSATPPVPAPPEGGVAGTDRRADLSAAADRMHAAAERFEQASFHGQISVSVSGAGGARTRGMRIRSRGAVTADMGVSMPGAKESDDDWV